MSNTRILPLFGGGGGGEQGIQGIQGIQGPAGSGGGGTGIQGLQGIQGIAGSDGLNGQDGLQGIQGIAGSDGLQGAVGETGAQGTTGATGLQGADGIQGYVGLQGTTGETGAKGIQGIQGITGLQGPAGEGGGSSAWYGSMAEFQAISHPDENTDYYISDAISYNELKDKPDFASINDVNEAKNDVLYEVREDFEHLHGQYMTMQQFQAITPKENYNYFIEGNTIAMVVTFTDQTTATYNVVVDD